MLNLKRAVAALTLAFTVGACAEPTAMLAPVASDAAVRADGYTVVDLGTIPGFTSLEVLDFNDAGDVLIRAARYDMDGNSLYRGYVARGGAMLDVGTLGGPDTYVMAMNELGQVTGYSLRGDRMPRAFVWENGVMRDLFIGTGASYASDINDLGQVSGTFYLGTAQMAFFWDNGDAPLTWGLGTLGGHASFGGRLNNAGEVVGTSYVAGGNEHAFFWSKSDAVMIDLGVLNGYRSFARGINERGDVIGMVEGVGFESSFFWSRGESTDLGSLGGTRTTAAAVSDHGEVTGWSYINSSSIHAFHWRNGRLTDLGTLGGDNSLATGINKRGDVVGWSQRADGQYHGFVWRNGRMAELPSLGGARSQAHFINDDGAIAGYSDGSDGQQHIVIWRR